MAYSNGLVQAQFRAAYRFFVVYLSHDVMIQPFRTFTPHTLCLAHERLCPRAPRQSSEHSRPAGRRVRGASSQPGPSRNAGCPGFRRITLISDVISVRSFWIPNTQFGVEQHSVIYICPHQIFKPSRNQSRIQSWFSNIYR